MTIVRNGKCELYLQSDMDSAQHFSFRSGKVAALCRRGPDKTEPNDDSAAIVETSNGAIVLAVADGVGSCPVGYKASAIAVQSVADQVVAMENEGNLRLAILNGIEKANENILGLGVGAATTLSVVEINQSRARAYQIGDSMSLIMGQRGAMKWKSTAHSPVGYAVEAGMLDEIDAMHHEDRHLVSNLLGMHEMHIDVGPSLPLAARDSLIVGSDGLFDNVPLDEVIELGSNGKIDDRMRAIDLAASERMAATESAFPGKPDDLTFLLFTV